MLTLHDVFLLPLDAEKFSSRRPEQPLNCVFSCLSGEQRGVGIGEADVGAANPDRTGLDLWAVVLPDDAVIDVRLGMNEGTGSFDGCFGSSRPWHTR